MLRIDTLDMLIMDTTLYKGERKEITCVSAQTKTGAKRNKSFLEAEVRDLKRIWEHMCQYSFEAMKISCEID